MTNIPDTFPCRLYVILAREAPVAVIFRRGPSKRVQVIRWDTATDTFTPGQWFHGRIYEKRGDLSPDGEYLIYFAQKYNIRTLWDEEYTYSWTAISRLPYLTALALWPKGDAWDGGGLFLTRNQVWLNHPPERMEPHRDHRPQGLEIIGNERTLGEDDPILLRRLVRDGWRHTQQARGEFLNYNQGFVTYAPDILRKQNPFGWQKLTLTNTLSGFTRRTDYSVRYAEGQEYRLNDAVWADWDQRGRLVYARSGKLFAATFGDDGLEEQELADFNANQPDTLAAPEWAKKWEETNAEPKRDNS